MPAQSIVVVWVLASELSSPSTAALTRAAEEALGENTKVSVQALRADEPPRATGDAPIAYLRWIDPAHESVRIRCYAPRTRSWVERVITFRASDPEAERGRTLGFLLATMVVESVPAERARAALTVAPEARASTVALGAAAAAGGPGTATGFGVWLGVDAALSKDLWLGGAAEARFGEIPSAQATSRIFSAGAAGTWRFWAPPGGSWLALRGSAALVLLSISHLSSDDPAPDVKNWVAPGFGAVVQAGYEFATVSAVFADLGVEAVPGTVEVVVRGQREAVWPWLLPVARLGIRTSF